MKRVPHSREVDRAFKALKVDVQTSLRALNRTASKAMAKGDYSAAEALAAKGREIQTFLSDVVALRERWRDLRVGTNPGSLRTTTPLWAYYQPILRALSELGGEARRRDLEPALFSLVNSSLTALDRESIAGARERWQAMIRRARKHLIGEGWLEDRPGSLWVITEAGRAAAKGGSHETPPMGTGQGSR